MKNRSNSAGKTKPDKPFATFPLFPHANGTWAKKILGKLYYFGAWDDPETALKKLNHDWPYRVLLATAHGAGGLCWCLPISSLLGFVFDVSLNANFLFSRALKQGLPTVIREAAE